jgi:hypothetical protein
VYESNEIEICPIFMFKTQRERDEHVLQSNTSTVCPLCRYAFPNRTALEGHILTLMSSLRVGGKNDDCCIRSMVHNGYVFKAGRLSEGKEFKMYRYNNTAREYTCACETRRCSASILVVKPSPSE